VFAVRGAQVGAHDDVVDVLEAADCFERDHDLVEREEVQPVETDLHAAVEDRYRELPLEWDVLGAQLDGECVLVDRLQEPGAEFLVHGDGCRNDLGGQPAAGAPKPLGLSLGRVRAPLFAPAAAR